MFLGTLPSIVSRRHFGFFLFFNLTKWLNGNYCICLFARRKTTRRNCRVQEVLTRISFRFCVASRDIQPCELILRWPFNSTLNEVGIWVVLRELLSSYCWWYSAHTQVSIQLTPRWEFSSYTREYAAHTEVGVRMELIHRWVLIQIILKHVHITYTVV